MMRFHLDLTNGRTVLRDEDGVEADGLINLLQHARTAIREMHASGDLQGTSTGWLMVVRDEHGIVRHTIEIDLYTGSFHS
jgi:hypothetical protein